MTQEQATKNLSTSLYNLQQRKGQLTVDQVAAEVINLSCLEILKNNRHKDSQDITLKYVNAARRLVPEYGEREGMHALMGVPMNVQWDGMWEFLRNYFMSNHGFDIDGDNTAETKIFYSTRHKRYESDQLVNDSEADRTIDLLLTENRKVLLVNIQPTLHAKKGYLTSRLDDRLIYTGSDPDYRFTIVLDEIEEVNKFILEMPNRSLRLEYFE
jgi:hypothetical protein